VSWLLEFPLYQWTVFALHCLSNINVDYLSRLASLGLAYGSAYLICLELSKVLGQKPWILTGFFTLNPFYMYWATTGLVDWMAIFLGTFAASAMIKVVTSVKFTKRTYLTLIMGILLSTAGILIKPTHALFGFGLMLMIEYFFTKEKQVRFSKSIIGLTLLPGVICDLSWSRYTSRLYGPLDSRNIWNQDSSHFNWYFGNKQQYSSIFDNLLLVFKRFLSSSFGVWTFVVCISVIFIWQKYIHLTVALTVLSCVYVALLINLNMVHQYYQIPMLFSFGIILVLGFASVKESNFWNKNETPLTIFVLISLMFSIGSISSDSRNYLTMLNNGSDGGSICPTKFAIDGPVLVPLVENPEYLYACGIEAFESNFSNPIDVINFLNERKSYHYMYYNLDTTTPVFQGLAKQLGIKSISKVDGNWYKVIFS
jgi:hypothetical protein